MTDNSAIRQVERARQGERKATKPTLLIAPAPVAVLIVGADLQERAFLLVMAGSKTFLRRPTFLRHESTIVTGNFPPLCSGQK